MESAYSKSVDTLLVCWEQFDIAKRLQSIKQSMETVSNSQAASLKSRKELAAKTKEIKSIAPGERLAFMKSLLKLYQEEIDHLTVRSQ
jgi:singapore isolate B (sub-type 7) whole genome shotgun sequence assembly, scaffold_5